MFGPTTLTEVLAAREGRFEDISLPVRDRPVVHSLPTRNQTSPTIRLADGEDPTLDGYATVYDASYDMYGGPAKGGWTETVVGGAGKKSLSESPDVVLLVNHQGLPLARTTSGTLDLSEDRHGLHAVATLDRRDPEVQALVPKMERGDLSEMSFAFRIVRQEWNDDYTDRRILEYSIDRGDVAIVTYGANPHTHADLRSVEEFLASLQSDPDLVMAELRAAGEDPRAVLMTARDAIDRILGESRTDPGPEPVDPARLRALIDTIPITAPA